FVRFARRIGEGLQCLDVHADCDVSSAQFIVIAEACPNITEVYFHLTDAARHSALDSAHWLQQFASLETVCNANANGDADPSYLLMPQSVLLALPSLIEFIGGFKLQPQPNINNSNDEVADAVSLWSDFFDTHRNLSNLFLDGF